MLTLKVNQLKAALCHSAVKDVRYYLKSVMLKVVGNDPVVCYLSATDGFTMFLGHANVTWDGEPQKGDWEMLIPVDAIKTALKGIGKAKVITLSALPDGRYKLGDILFTPIDGKFPDVERVIPTSFSGETGQFNLELLVRCQDSLRFWCNHKTGGYKLLHNGESAASYRVPGAVCVVMGVRVDYEAELLPMPSSFSAKE
jgi:DNA polymerase III sliding clamp (beta) subunit (PCNA family)